MRRAMWLLLMAACSGTSGGAGSPPSGVADHRGQQPAARPKDRHIHSASILPAVGGIEENPVPACPPETDLVPQLRVLWQMPPDASIDVLACVRGRFGRPGWLVHALVDMGEGDQESGERIVVHAASGGGGVIAEVDAASLSPVDRFDAGGGSRWEAVDLDGDDVAELLELQEWNQVAVLSTALAVYRIDRGAIRRVGTLPLAHDNRGGKGMTARRIVRCGSQHAIADGPDGRRIIQIEGTITTAGRQAGPTVAAHCPLPGSHRYRVVGGALEEVRP